MKPAVREISNDLDAVHGPGVDRPLVLLKNGDEIFPAMLGAIRTAQRSVCFETYIYWSGKIAEAFAEALSERARAGVPVRVLLDWEGCLKMDDALLARMKKSGIDVAMYRPLHWFNLRRTNYRTHRKLLIVDGEIGFTGGVGIADTWLGHGQDPDHWRDNHYRITGATVSKLQRAFFDNWITVGRLAPDETDPLFYPEVEQRHSFEVVAGAPWDGRDNLQRLFLQAVDDADHHLRIGTAYFMPGKQLFDALIRARSRGVDVRVLMGSKHTDKAIVRRASRAHWGPLLEAGVRLYDYLPTLYHVKMLVVDERWITIGSANFDARSCRLNDELNVVVRDSTQITEHIEMFDSELEASRQITLATWNERPPLVKFRDWFSQLFRRHL